MLVCRQKQDFPSCQSVEWKEGKKKLRLKVEV